MKWLGENMSSVINLVFYGGLYLKNDACNSWETM